MSETRPSEEALRGRVVGLRAELVSGVGLVGLSSLFEVG